MCVDIAGQLEGMVGPLHDRAGASRAALVERDDVAVARSASSSGMCSGWIPGAPGLPDRYRMGLPALPLREAKRATASLIVPVAGDSWFSGTVRNPSSPFTVPPVCDSKDSGAKWIPPPEEVHPAHMRRSPGERMQPASSAQLPVVGARSKVSQMGSRCAVREWLKHSPSVSLLVPCHGDLAIRQRIPDCLGLDGALQPGTQVGPLVDQFRQTGELA